MLRYTPVRKGKDRKIILGCRTRAEIDKVREKLEKEGKHLRVEDIQNKDPLVVLRDLLSYNGDEEVVRRGSSWADQKSENKWSADKYALTKIENLLERDKARVSCRNVCTGRDRGGKWNNSCGDELTLGENVNSSHSAEIDLNRFVELSCTANNQFSPIFLTRKQPSTTESLAADCASAANHNTSVRRDLRNYNKQLIKNAIEQNRGSKVFAKRLGTSHLTKLKNSEGKTVTSVPAILAEVESFYQKLYASHAPKPPPDANDPRATLTRHFTDDLPEVDEDEIGRALKQLQNGKAPGEDGITTELLKAGGTPMLKILKELFNSVISNGTTPKAWSESVAALFFKKGDKILLKNYRPIALLSHINKLFSRVLTNRLAARFDAFQPPEQAGFRKGFSTVDHIHTVRQIMQKSQEYNQLLCLAFVDYEKAFDSVETWAVLESLQRCQVDWRYDGGTEKPIQSSVDVHPSTES
ncbi:hypothetical protein ABMA27_013658 [Loxostege sticticalis]|uniref:Reverse transcriptase domain-containing protein n=1 Tax=Loxostege sticticalis TaxID=481309 RepID=A0ABR3IG24_LOXSC